jgi:hypothetical protein
MLARAFQNAPKLEQLPLVPRRELLSRYSVGAPFAPQSDTSREAAEAIRPHVAGLRAMVLRALGLGHGRTAQQLELETGLPGNTVRPRLLELIERGLAVKTEETRPTLSGRKANVYRVTDAGALELAGVGAA